MLSETLQIITQVGILVFIVAGMAAMGLSLTFAQIVDALSDARTTVLLLAVNFVVVPLIAVAIAGSLPMETDAATSIVILGCVAGAPFLPKLAQLAKGDAALAVGGMVLLMVVTIAYAPIVVPLAVQGASVDAWSIAQSLIVLMLLPLAIGLLVRARYRDLATAWAGPAGQASTIGLLIGIAAGLLASWQQILGSIGSWIFIATALLLIVSLAAGWLAAYGRSAGTSSVMALATAQRNISAALVIATSLGGNVVVYTLVAGLALPIVLIVLAGELGRRVGAPAPAAAQGG